MASTVLCAAASSGCLVAASLVAASSALAPSSASAVPLEAASCSATEWAFVQILASAVCTAVAIAPPLLVSSTSCTAVSRISSGVPERSPPSSSFSLPEMTTVESVFPICVASIVDLSDVRVHWYDALWYRLECLGGGCGVN